MALEEYLMLKGSNAMQIKQTYLLPPNHSTVNAPIS